MDKRRDEGHGNLSCSFCGKNQKEVKKLIAGPTVYICDECIGLCNDIIDEEIEKEEQNYGLAAVPKPAEIKNVLDEYVIGQERAKKILAVAVHNHYKRIDAKVGADDVELQKSNILLLGPTGRGKPLLAQTLARSLHVPVAIADATNLTEEVQPEDLRKYGMIPEFVGRLPVIAPLHELNEEALIDILTKPKNALVKQYQKLFEMDGVKVKFTKGALQKVATNALRHKSG